MYFVSSTTFNKRPCPSSEDDEALLAARVTLLNRIFLGTYVERRHVGQIKDYRDVVAISPAESELITDMNKIRQKIYRNCNVKWVGITGPEFENAPSGYCLWVTLTNIPFGEFWFQIKQIKRENEEIIFRLKCIRPARLEDYKELHNCVKEKCDGDEKFNGETSEYTFEFDPVEKFSTIYISLNEAIRKIRPHLTWTNFLVVAKFLMAVVIVLISTMINCIWYFGEFTLRLIREIAILVETFTPIINQAIDSITKVIGGLFLLIALLFRTRYPRQPRRQVQPLPEFPYLLPGSQMSLTGISRSISSNSNTVPIGWKESNSFKT